MVSVNGGVKGRNLLFQNQDDTAGGGVEQSAQDRDWARWRIAKAAADAISTFVKLGMSR